MGHICYSDKDRVDLKPEYIHQMMVEKAKMEDEITKLREENTQFKANNTYLLTENDKLKLTCGQYQLMIQTQINNQNQNNLNHNFFKNNDYKVWRNQIKDLMNNDNNFNNNCSSNNFNNNNNFNANNCNIVGGQGNNMNNFNNNTNNFNSNNCNNIGNNIKKSNQNEQIMNIIFKFEGGKKCPIVTFNSCKLGDIFYLALMQTGNNEDSDIRQFKFCYCTEDISKHFVNNDEVEVLHLPRTSFINVMKYNNVK